MNTHADEKTSITPANNDVAPDDNRLMKSPASHKAGTNFRIDILAFLTFLITSVSGMALMRVHPGERSAQVGLLDEQIIWGLSIFEWQHLHTIIGWIFVALVAIHLITHRRWVASMLSR